MIEATGGGDGQLAALLSTHPASDERLERLRALAAAA
jgi:Zn-dependent protease with chaperone function